VCETSRALLIGDVHIPADIPADHITGNSADDRHDRIPIPSAKRRSNARARNCAKKFANILIAGIRSASRNTKSKGKYRS
jgi:hypothetical protein